MAAEASPRGRVLILEDEGILRTNMIRGLSKFPGLEVYGAGSVAEALTILDRGEPSLLISDIDLPGRLGIEMIGEIRRRGFSTPIVFVSAYLKAYQAQIPPNAGVDVYEKPLSIEQLRTIVVERLEQPERPSSPFGVPEYLQIAGIGRHSVRIQVTSPSGSGEIVVHDGEAWAAFDARGSGLEAFIRLTNAGESVVTCTTLNGPAGVRNLSGPIESLLLEAACRHDEARIDVPSEAPIPSAAPAVPEPPPAPDPFDELMDRGLSYMIAKQYQEAHAVFREALTLRPEDRRVLANLTRLKDLLEP